MSVDLSGKAFIARSLYIICAAERNSMPMDEHSHILVVDDNPEIREIIHILLEGEGFEVSEAADGSEALEKLKRQDFDLMILDIMMPDLNGYQTCRRIREDSNVPILFLSARTKDSDKTLGFSSGGDDYLAKPFSYNELISRSKALIRRYQVYQGKQYADRAEEKTEGERAPVIRCHHLLIDEAAQTVTSAGNLLELTDTEFAILLLLIKNRRQVFSASRIYEAVWQEPYYYGANNVVMVHIRNLRLKIEKDAKNPALIKTVWGKGYCCV